MRNEFAVVASLGIRFESQKTGWRDVKALIMVAARAGPDQWPAAADLADALGVHPDQQEAIYHEVYGPTGERSGPPPRRTP